MNKSILLSWGFVISLGLLLANDLFLKDSFPGFLTGKLSDFAGLFVFPLFFSAIVPKRRLTIYFFTFIGFVFWKTSLASGFLAWLNDIFPFRVSRVIDYSDFIALCILPISYFYSQRMGVQARPSWVRRSGEVLISFVALFSFVATSGTKTPYASFPLNCSANELRSAISTIEETNQQYRIPDEMKGYTVVPGDSDSSRLYIYAIKKPEILFELGVVARDGNWSGTSCELFVMGFLEKEKRQWEFHRGFWSKPRKDHPNVIRFEAEVLPTIRAALKEFTTPQVR